MANNSKAPVIENPQLIDRVLGEIQNGLVENIGWLNFAFGRAQKITRMVGNKKFAEPQVYTGVGNEYRSVFPDSKIGNFSFFWLEDPQTVDFMPNQGGAIKSGFSLIFWFDLRRVYNSENNRNTEALKVQILQDLNGGYGGINLRGGRIKINRIYEQSENIYRGFTLDEIDNQFLMHPFAGFRFEGELTINQPCI